MNKRTESVTVATPSELSYVHGSSEVALSGDTLGAFFDKIAAGCFSDDHYGENPQGRAARTNG